MTKKLKLQIFQKPEHVFQTVTVNLSDATPFQKSCVNCLGVFWCIKAVERNIILKLLENLQSTSKLIILLEILIYTLNNLSKFGGCHTHFSDL